MFEEDEECEECGSTAWIDETYTVDGTDFDGSDATFVVNKIRCLSGHQYHSIVEDLIIIHGA